MSLIHFPVCAYKLWNMILMAPIIIMEHIYTVGTAGSLNNHYENVFMHRRTVNALQTWHWPETFFERELRGLKTLLVVLFFLFVIALKYLIGTTVLQYLLNSSLRVVGKYLALIYCLFCRNYFFNVGKTDWWVFKKPHFRKLKLCTDE